jgi:membrane protein
MQRVFAIALDAFYRFLEDDGWAIASYIAVANLLLETWPREVAGPIAGEMHRVLTTTRGDVLTASAVFSVYFASSGVESLRIGLNRAYDAVETRNWFLLRFESIVYVLVGALALLALALLVVLAPLLFATALKYAPWLEPLEATFTFARFAVATSVITLALVLVHKWLPAGHRRYREIVPGILATLILWLAGGIMFGRYLEEFASSYVTYYAGLASVMTALVFLYLTAASFMYGGELNSAICRPSSPDHESGTAPPGSS